MLARRQLQALLLLAAFAFQYSFGQSRPLISFDDAAIQDESDEHIKVKFPTIKLLKIFNWFDKKKEKLEDKKEKKADLLSDLFDDKFEKLEDKKEKKADLLSDLFEKKFEKLEDKKEKKADWLSDLFEKKFEKFDVEKAKKAELFEKKLAKWEDKADKFDEKLLDIFDLLKTKENTKLEKKTKLHEPANAPAYYDHHYPLFAPPKYKKPTAHGYAYYAESASSEEQSYAHKPIRPVKEKPTVYCADHDYEVRYFT